MMLAYSALPNLVTTVTWQMESLVAKLSNVLLGQNPCLRSRWNAPLCGTRIIKIACAFPAVVLSSDTWITPFCCERQQQCFQPATADCYMITHAMAGCGRL